MKLVSVLGVGSLAASFCCCCGSPDELEARLSSLLGSEAAPVEAPATPEATAAPVVQEEVVIGVPPGSTSQPAPEGIFYRYTHPTLPVAKARQFHDGWFRRKGWQPQVDAATATGWTMEAVKGDQRMIIDIQPLGAEGVNVIFKLL